ncbi:uncharacterized protein Triagg1_7749 [Trichoderma aggressivum f. europaeum]|uniref:SSCRP protein n=1 Tax=Trichoderma aggressivum f. europaeum TaxID=173218 RepID=A0AAE1LYG1_9HYPO|nr:hypothetical protein Triagg1_7749 [Trichoderma aggressivum f. europaeum]
MKTSTTTMLFIVFAASVVRPDNISPRDIDAQKLCGDLEVMKMDVNQLPPGISLDNVRMCEEHPLHQDDIDILDGASLAPTDVRQGGGTSALPLQFGTMMILVAVNVANVAAVAANGRLDKFPN